MHNYKNKTFLISRTDAIGDVVLTLPLCGWLKKNIEGARVLFLGRTYTRAVINSCPEVDAFINWDELNKLSNLEQKKSIQSYQIDVVVHVFPVQRIAVLCKNAGIPVRIGTRNRFFHWFSCNKLVSLSRRHSPYHEAQLNLMLLRPLGLKHIPDLDEVAGYQHLVPTIPLPDTVQAWLNPGQPAIILHPTSQGSGREWELDKFGHLAKLLHQRGIKVFVSGTLQDHSKLQPWLAQYQTYITDIAGKLSLEEFISFIKACTGLVAAGTGPLHLAAGLGVHALGLFPPITPIHPGRWAPIGPLAEYLVQEKNCNACQNNPAACLCMQRISVQDVMARLESWV